MLLAGQVIGTTRSPFFGASGSARPCGSVFHGAVRALSALGESLGWDFGGDVCAGRFDTESEDGHRGFMRSAPDADAITLVAAELECRDDQDVGQTG